MVSYKLNQIGIGDMVSFVSDIINSKEQDYTITLNKSAISKYKNDAPLYWEFSKLFLSRLLVTKNVTFTDQQNLPDYVINTDNFLQSSKNEKVCSHFRNVFATQDPPIESPYIVLSTKARNYQRSFFDSQKDFLFSEINSLGLKVILLGEKEIQYNYEYSIWGQDQIYSIYNDSLKLINPELLIDMTVPKLGLTTPNIENLFNDMSIAYKSRLCINIGVGGFFCTTIFSGKLRSIGLYQNHVNGIYVFQDTKNMIENVKLLCAK